MVNRLLTYAALSAEASFPRAGNGRESRELEVRENKHATFRTNYVYDKNADGYAKQLRFLTKQLENYRDRLFKTVTDDMQSVRQYKAALQKYEKKLLLAEKEFQKSKDAIDQKAKDKNALMQTQRQKEKASQARKQKATELREKSEEELDELNQQFAIQKKHIDELQKEKSKLDIEHEKALQEQKRAEQAISVTEQHILDIETSERRIQEKITKLKARMDRVEKKKDAQLKKILDQLKALEQSVSTHIENSPVARIDHEIKNLVEYVRIANDDCKCADDTEKNFACCEAAKKAEEEAENMSARTDIERQLQMLKEEINKVGSDRLARHQMPSYVPPPSSHSASTATDASSSNASSSVSSSPRTHRRHHSRSHSSTSSSQSGQGSRLSKQKSHLSKLDKSKRPSGIHSQSASSSGKSGVSSPRRSPSNHSGRPHSPSASHASSKQTVRQRIQSLQSHDRLTSKARLAQAALKDRRYQSHPTLPIARPSSPKPSPSSMLPIKDQYVPKSNSSERDDEKVTDTIQIKERPPLALVDQDRRDEQIAHALQDETQRLALGNVIRNLRF